jgi:uncharacterized SAM-binding protein YcdF (DUF218 family)
LYIVTTPIVNERAAASRDSEIYGAPPEAATPPAARSARARRLRLADGAALGIALWLLLLTLGFPWVFHSGGMDGLLPAMIIGAILGITRWRVALLAGVLALSLVLLIVAYTSIIVGPARSFIRNDPLPAHADAIVVLSAGVNDDGMILPQATDRLLKGLELLNRGIAPVLVLGRETYIVNGQLVSSKADHERILSLTPGALSKVVVSGVTHSTHDEAKRAAALFRARGWKRIVVVTSPLHTRRACGTFERAGVVVSCAASDSRELAVHSLRVPGDRIHAFQLWLYELAGSLRYRQLGWL